jgi:hypothetical protein
VFSFMSYTDDVISTRDISHSIFRRYCLWQYFQIMLWYGYQIYCLFLSGQVRFLKPYIVFVPIYPYNIMVTTAAVPDLPFKHRAPLARWGPFSCQKQMMDFCWCGSILNLRAFYFGAIPDIMIELIVDGSVSQSRQSGPK